MNSTVVVLKKGIEYFYFKLCIHNNNWNNWVVSFVLTFAF